MLGTFDAVLTEAKWTPNKLGAEINTWLVAHGYARDRIHPTSPYHWRRTGNAPSAAAVAAAAAHVLSGRVGRVITVGQLWPAADTGADGPRQATLGLLGPGTPDDAVAQLDELTRPGAPYLPGSERVLLTAALDGLHGVQRPQTHTAAGDRVLPPALDHNPTHRRALLGEATTLLTPLTTAGPDVDHQRSALLHGCYLAKAHLRRGDLEQACHVTRTALTRLESVQPGRCIQGLQDLRAAFGRFGSPWARDLVTQVDEALSTP